METIITCIIAAVALLLALVVLIWAGSEIIELARWVFPSNEKEESGPFNK